MRLQLAPRRVAPLVAALLMATAGRTWAQKEAPLPIDAHAALDYGQYADTDHVFVETPSLRGVISNPTEGWSLDGQYLVDIVSAASVDIVSTASRRWNEMRQAGEVGFTYKPHVWGLDVNGSISDEPDYLSVSSGFAVSQDLDDRNVTWLLGYSYGHDIAGRTGTPFSVFSHALDRNAFHGGLTLVLGRSTIGSLVGDVILENGDQSKPYRYIPLFAPGTNVPLGASVELVNQLRVSERPLEQLPLSRQRYALTGRIAHRYTRSTLRVDERLYADSWLLAATTTDARLLFDPSRRVEHGPHLRLHGQTAVSFWQRAYVFGPGYEYPALRAGDRELGPLVSGTAGWTFQIGLGPIESPWVVGVDLNATWTQYLDDIYLTQRFSTYGGAKLEKDL